jgi:hypothetical protein
LAPGRGDSTLTGDVLSGGRSHVRVNSNGTATPVFTDNALSGFANMGAIEKASV